MTLLKDIPLKAVIASTDELYINNKSTGDDDAKVLVSGFRITNNQVTDFAAGVQGQKLDDLTATDDNTDLDATTSKHGLFPKADKVKLNAIETSATADQSDAEIETAYNNQVGIVSQVDAEAGTSTTPERWTPQRVSQAIAALGGGGGGSGNVPLVVIGMTPQGVIAYPDIHAMATQTSKISGWLFPDGATAGTVNFKALLPEAIDTVSDVHIMLIMAPVAAIGGTPTVHLELDGQYIADGEDIDVAFADVAESVDKDIDGSIENATVHIFDLAVNPSSGDRFFNFQITRDPTHVNDDATDDVILLGVIGWAE